MMSLYILEVDPLHPLTPWFILSIRALYARDVQGEGIDNEFGPSECSSGRDTRETTILFADIELNDEMNGVEEVLSDGSARLGVHGSMFNVVYP